MAHPSAVEERILELYQSLLRHVGGSNAPDFVGVDLTMAQAKVLYVVTVRPGITMAALAAELGVGPSAVSGLVERLVVMGCVTREPGADRRQQLVTVTPIGAESLGQLQELRVELIHRLIRGFDDTELQALQTALVAMEREAQRLDEPDSSF